MLDTLFAIFCGVFEFFDPIFMLFGVVYEMDDRPNARAVTIGCAGLFAVGFILVWFWLAR